MNIPTESLVTAAKTISNDKNTYLAACKLGMVIGITVFVGSGTTYIAIKSM